MTEESTQNAELTLEAVFDAALAEDSGLATAPDTDSISPVDEVDAEDSDEQTEPSDDEASSEQADDTFDFEDIEEDEVEPAESPIDLNAKVEVEGHGELTIEQLRNGYMMQADYTRSKQALKAERDAWAQEQETAVRIIESLQEDPVGLAAYLAVETGLLTEQDLQGRNVDNLREQVRIPKREEMEAEIERQVAERLQSHPEIQQAKVQAVRAEIEREFQQIEQSVGKPLSEKARIKVIEYAAAHNLDDLTVAFDALSAASARKRAQSAKLKAAAPDRPGTRGPTEDKPAKAETIEDALALALALHGE